MKKICNFLCVTLIFFSVFACTMPSELEITGAPSVKFAANKSFSDFFDDMIDNVLNTGNNNVERRNCTNPSLQYKTFFIHIEAFRDDDYECDTEEAELLGVGNSGSIWINETEIPGKIQNETNNTKKYFVTQKDTELPPPKEPYNVPFNGFGEYLEGFGFTGLKSKMYISGTDIVNMIDIELYHIDSDGTPVLISKEKDKSLTPDTVPYEKIDIDSLEEYTGLDLPPGGTDIDIIDIINSNEDLSVTYKVKIKKGTKVDLEWLKGTQVIIVEIVIWLPMTFEAEEDEAIINFTGFFDGISDFFNTISENEFIENMNIKIGLQPLNPFGDGVFVIKDDNYSIQSPMDDYSFIFIFNKEDLEYINKNKFIPGYSIKYRNGDMLGIPNGDAMITTITLNAGIKLNMEL